MKRVAGLLHRPRAQILAATIALALAAGAVAFWMASGSGEARTVLGSPQQITLTAGIPQQQLAPGLAPGRASSVAVVATNPNPYFVTFTSLALDAGAGTGGFDVDAGHSGCNLAAIHFTPQPPPVGVFGPGWRVPPKVASTDGTLAFELSGALSMDEDAANACQGAELTVHLVAGS
jgi:hypothetical protein